MATATLRKPGHSKYKSPLAKSEINNDPSETIPDQSLSVKDMLERHVQGLLTPGEISEGIYHDDITHDEEISSPRTKLELLEEAQQATETVTAYERLKQRDTESQQSRSATKIDADSTTKELDNSKIAEGAPEA